MTDDQEKSIAFLPGWGFHPHIFQPLAQHLADFKQQFVRLDQLEQTIFPKESILIGWSLGGLIATLLCSYLPQQFSKLILINSTPKFLADNSWEGISSEDASQFLTQLEKCPKSLLTYFCKLCAWPSKNRHLQTQLQQHTLDNQNNLKSQLNFLLQTDARKAYQTLSIPCLEIRSLNDPLIPANHRALHTDHYLAGGHASFLTHVEQTICHIRRFIDEPSNN